MQKGITRQAKSGLACRLLETARYSMKGDDYMRGGHFWTHFRRGLVGGGFSGARMFWSFFESRLASIGCAAAFALIFALAVGYWGDPLWRVLTEASSRW